MKKNWRVPVLTYHAIDRGPSSLFTPPEVFESHLRALEGLQFRTMTLRALLQMAREGEPPPERTFVLTFDDGYESVATEAWPRLLSRGFRATLFLVSGRCGGDNRWPTQNASVPTRRLLTWKQVGRLAAEGAELGAHSRTHTPLSQLPEDRAEEEIAGSKAEIESRTGQCVPLFAYPYGASTAATEAIARRHFEGAVSTQLGYLGPESDPFRIPRIDCHYLSARAIERLQEPLFRTHLAIRQALRAARRRIRRDWSPVALTNSETDA